MLFAHQFMDLKLNGNMKKPLFFHVSIKISDKVKRNRFSGKFIGVGKSALSVKQFIEEKLLKEFPDATGIDIKMLPMSEVGGMFIEDLPSNEVASSEN